MTGHQKNPSRSDRALELFEKGLDTSTIGARLGVDARSVGTMLKRAKAKREKKAARASRVTFSDGTSIRDEP
jgi:hypothetical protein